MGEGPNHSTGRRDSAFAEKRTGEHGGDPLNKDARERRFYGGWGSHKMKRLIHPASILLAWVFLLAVCVAQATPIAPTVVVSYVTQPPSVHLDIENSDASMQYDIYRAFQIDAVQWVFQTTLYGNNGTLPYDDTTIGNERKAFYKIICSPAPTP